MFWANLAKNSPSIRAEPHADPERERRTKYGFARLIDFPRAERLVVARHGRLVAVVTAVEEYERLKLLETRNVASRPSTTGKAE